MTDNSLAIDELALDREWLEQANKYLFHAEKLADAKQQLDSAKNTLEAVKADMHKAVSQDPVAFGIVKPKPTIADLDAAVSSHPEYRKAQQRIIDASHLVRMQEGMVEALQHRKRALENLVTLHTTGYHSEPRAKRKEDKETIEDNELRAHYSKSTIQRKGKEHETKDQ